MWVFLSDSFLSIVEHDRNPGLLLVRARIQGDIEKVFPEAEVSETPNADYRFRAAIGRERVADRMSQLTKSIHYSNFKNSVEDDDRRQAYIRVWDEMYLEQHRRLDASEDGS